MPVRSIVLAKFYNIFCDVCVRRLSPLPAYRQTGRYGFASRYGPRLPVGRQANTRFDAALWALPACRQTGAYARRAATPRQWIVVRDQWLELRTAPNFEP